MALISIQINADSHAEFERALAILGTHVSLAGLTTSVPEVGEASAVVDVDVKPASKPKATKAKVEDAPAPAPEPAPEPAPAPAIAPMGEKSPETMRNEAIKTLQNHFAKNQNDMPSITAIQKKYGVNMFSEIPDDKAAAFLADAKLVESGSFKP